MRCTRALSTSNPIPSPISGDAVKNPISCSGLVNAQISGNEIQLDGGIPACGAEGLRCPLSGAQATTTACGTKRAIAVCAQQRWTLGCEDPGDAATSTDAKAGTDSGDAATDASTD